MDVVILELSDRCSMRAFDPGCNGGIVNAFSGALMIAVPRAPRGEQTRHDRGHLRPATHRIVTIRFARLLLIPIVDCIFIVFLSFPWLT